MGYAMIASNVAPRCSGAAEKVPQVSRPGSILRHCGTCGTPYVEERMAHWRTPRRARAAQCLCGGAHAAGAFGLPRCARWPAGAPAGSAVAGRPAHQFIVAYVAASQVKGIEIAHGFLSTPLEQMGLHRRGPLPPKLGARRRTRCRVPRGSDHSARLNGRIG
jgi:hypothetical protein